MVKKEEFRVHATHCCKWHGCKYGDKDCPVVLGVIEQEYLCEDCSEDLREVDYYENKLKEIKEIKEFSRLKMQKDSIKFGDVLYRPCLSYAGKKNFINTNIVKDIIDDNIVCYDAFGQRWSYKLEDLDKTIFRNKDDAIAKLYETMTSHREEGSLDE